MTSKSYEIIQALNEVRLDPRDIPVKSYGRSTEIFHSNGNSIRGNFANRQFRPYGVNRVTTFIQNKYYRYSAPMVFHNPYKPIPVEGEAAIARYFLKLMEEAGIKDVQVDKYTVFPILELSEVDDFPVELTFYMGAGVDPCVEEVNTPEADYYMSQKLIDAIMEMTKKMKPFMDTQLKLRT